jgi:four helix bundle protein
MMSFKCSNKVRVMKKSGNIVQNKSFEFALTVIELYRELQANKEFDISRQLLRSGTSIGANVEEAIAAYFKRDFLHKMSIASKEGRETSYWLRLIKAGNLIEVPDHYFSDINEINSILTSIVKTTSESLK